MKDLEQALDRAIERLDFATAHQETTYEGAVGCAEARDLLMRCKPAILIAMRFFAATSYGYDVGRSDAIIDLEDEARAACRTAGLREDVP